MDYLIQSYYLIVAMLLIAILSNTLIDGKKTIPKSKNIHKKTDDDNVNKNGNKLDHTPGTHNELCGTDLVKGKNTDAPDEAVAKAIVARKGDIVIVAEHGNIKLKAQNIWVETGGTENKGNFLVKSNGHIAMTAGEKVTFAGTKLCMIGKDQITLSSKGSIDLFCSDLNKSSPLAGIFSIFTNMSLANLLKLVDSECGRQL